jgi:hypothetical protein
MTERTRETKKENELVTVTKKKEENVEFLSNLSRKAARPTIRYMYDTMEFGQA